VRSLNDEKAKLIEQTVLKDNNERDAILAKQIGQPVTIQLLKPPQSVSGIYIGDIGSHYILQTDKNVTLVNKQNANYNLPELNENDFIFNQRLHWTFKAENRDQLLELSYEFGGGITWNVEYNLQLNALENKADFSGFITLENKTKKPSVKLILHYFVQKKFIIKKSH